MLCPFCLGEQRFKLEKADGSVAASYVCPECMEPIPALYVQDYRRYPPVVVSAVGFRGHGKTVYFAALFYALKKLRLARQWPDFWTRGLNEESLETIYHNVDMLADGTLPNSTPKNFPRPTLVQVNGIPGQPNCTWLCYDTGGEAFERASLLRENARFVARARTAVFLVALPGMKDPANEMYKLLNTYALGMAEMGSDTRRQHLVIVYTKADEISGLAGRWAYLKDYLLRSGTGLADQERYMDELAFVSEEIRAFTSAELGADEFLNLARHSFSSVSFSIVSALGAKPGERRLRAAVMPRRVMDPILWLMDCSQRSRSLLRRLLDRFIG